MRVSLRPFGAVRAAMMMDDGRFWAPKSSKTPFAKRDPLPFGMVKGAMLGKLHLDALMA